MAAQCILETVETIIDTIDNELDRDQHTMRSIEEMNNPEEPSEINLTRSPSIECVDLGNGSDEETDFYDLPNSSNSSNSSDSSDSSVSSVSSDSGDSSNSPDYCNNRILSASSDEASCTEREKEGRESPKNIC